MGNKKKRIKGFQGAGIAMGGRQRGQILVLVAIFMVGLLAATGLAVDSGFLLMRKSQFDRAVDAAALTGVPVISATDASTLNTANIRGRQLLSANGITIGDALTGACNADGSLPATINYCGQRLNGLMPGSVRYRVVVRWNVPLFFLPLIGFNNVPLLSDATAEYFPVVDMYASDPSETGMVKAALLSVFGPSAVTGYGDAYSPRWRNAGGSVASPWYGEMNGAYTFRISIPANYPFTKLRVELFDPDGYNKSCSEIPNPANPPANDRYSVYNIDGTVSTQACPGAQDEPRTLATADTDANPNYFVRVDEIWGNAGGVCCGGPQGWTPSATTRTLYRLFYYSQTPGGDLREVDLAYYVGKNAQDGAEARSTDLKWVTPLAAGASAEELMPAFGNTGTPAPVSTIPPASTITPATSQRPNSTSDSLYVAAEPRWAPASCATYAGQPLNAATGGTARSNALPGAAGCSGNGDFIIDLATEVPGMYSDPNAGGRREIFMQVISIYGGAENAFSLWAGPSRVNDAALIADLTTRGLIRGPFEAPAEVNARQVYIQRNRALTPPITVHSSYGVTVYAMGHMSMNWLAPQRVQVPVAYLTQDFSGQTVTLETFDNREAETGGTAGSASPIFFYFDKVQTTEDWSACYSHVAGDCTRAKDDDENPQFPQAPSWAFIPCRVPADPTHLNDTGGANPIAEDLNGGDCIGYSTGGAIDHVTMNDLWGQFPFVVPTERDSNPLKRLPFLGGTLYVSYRGRQQETSTWKMTVDARPVLVG